MNLKSLVANRLNGRPWAIAPVRMEGLLGGAATLTAGGDCPPWLQNIARPQGDTVTGSGIAVIPIEGPLVTRGDWLTTVLGATEYGAIAEAVSAAADDPAVRGILLEVDSPGGEVGGLFDLVEAIRTIRHSSGKPLSPRATADLQDDVDALYDGLVAVVAANRGVSSTAVRATEAAIYRGEKVVKAGLADRVGTLAQAIADLDAALQAKRIRAGPPRNRPAVRQSPSPSRTHAMIPTEPVIAEPVIDEAGEPSPADIGSTSDMMPVIRRQVIEAPPETASADRPLAVPDGHALAERLRT